MTKRGSRYFVSSLILAVLALLAAAGCGGRQESATPRPSGGPPVSRPAWLKQEPLIIAGNWDSMPIFRRRVGGNPLWQEEDYAREHTEETVRKLKDLGVTMAVIHFYKAYGLEAEKEQLDDARKLAALCKKHGLRVGVYVGSTVAYETFLAEKPEAEQWFVPSYMGRPVYYPGHSFRKRVYFMHPGYRQYMKRVLEIAVKDLRVDLIHFDNTSLQAQPEVFYHPQAVKDFREFLESKYTPEMRKKRFGFSEVRFVEPPVWDGPQSVLIDPMMQEWADFRCRQLAGYYGEMAAFIRGLNPEVAVENNPHSGISGRNTVWTQGVDYPRLLAHTDVVWTEEGNQAGVTPDGILISKIRTYKMASTLGNSIFTYTAGGGGSTLQMAEAMAYNRRNLGMVGGVLAGYEATPVQREYIRFYRNNFPLYRDVQSRPDVAVLHSYASLAFNNDLPWQSTMLFEQALIQGKVPFDIIFDRQLEDLSRYRVLVLADQECLSDLQVQQVRDFVLRGGSVVATEHTSLFNEWRQRRRDFALRDLFEVNSPEWRGARAQEDLLNAAEVRHVAGKGRVVYLASVKPVIEKPPAAPMTSKYWKLPANSQEMLDAVKWAAGGSLSLEVKAPLTVTAEFQEDLSNKRLLIHLLNYDSAKKPVGSVGVAVRIPEGSAVDRVTVLSPDTPGAGSLQWTMANGKATFAVPNLATYRLVLIQLK